MVYLERYLESDNGRWIALALDLAFAIQAGIKVTLAEIPYPEFLLLRVITEERNRHELEQVKNKPHGH